MDTQQHLGARVAEIVDQAIVQAAVARAGGERDVGNFQRAQHLRHRVAAPGRGAGDRFACRRGLHVGDEIVGHLNVGRHSAVEQDKIGAR